MSSRTTGVFTDKNISNGYFWFFRGWRLRVRQRWSL